ncbi:MAG TPA: hydroxymethylglutaryl-CoA reductase, degradative [Candidatus Avamphibacillus intestinigallinarum]|nr:hydroxymethylglutaryl-CoA reductase, degradative [Candidatus Avamphibacillus intestinigallinarum]
MRTSRIPGFYNKEITERQQLLQELYEGTDAEDVLFTKEDLSLPIDTANHMIENVIGTFGLPLGLGLNFYINDKEYIVPMAVEEASVVASASHIAKIVRSAGGFTTEVSERVMIGQIQVVGCEDLESAEAAILSEKTSLLEDANASYPSLERRGGGAKDLEVRIIGEKGASSYQKMLVVHLYVDTCDAMGANMINTMVEALAPTIEQLTRGKVYLRILSNYADQSLAKARCVIPPHLLETKGFSGEAVRDGVIHAYEFARTDPYRAVTHNKGIMNGIDPVIIATGNDWRAVEAGAHAYAARDGQYRSMSTWRKDESGNLVGELELPMSLGVVGGATRVHPTARFALRMLHIQSAKELAGVVVSVGLAQNLGALKALVTEGIQRGHMSLHARSIAIAAGAVDEEIEQVAKELIRLKEIRVGKAQELVASIKK